MGGMAFVAGDTILPAMVNSLGGAAWLVSLMPVMASLGFVLPPVFTAHHVQTLVRVKPLVMWTGILQRLPYLASALALFWFSSSSPLSALAVVALAPLVSGGAAGISLTAWQELVLKTIPSNRISSLWAVRNSTGALIGIAGGGIVVAILHRYPGAFGFGLLHLITFGLLTVSYVFFTFILETGVSPHTKEKGWKLRENLRSIPRLVTGDVQLRNYLFNRALINGIYIAIPFLAIHALEKTGRPASYLGFLLTVQMIGGVAGNMLAGYFGDRRGGKMVVLAGTLTCLVVFLLPIWGEREWIFLATFFILGLSVSGTLVGISTLAFEVAQPARRATCLAVMMVVNFPSMLLASAISTLVWSTTRSFILACLLSLTCLVLSILFLLRIEEPRKKRKPTIPASALAPNH